MHKNDFTGIKEISTDKYLKWDYYQKIIGYLKDKDVLDVGCLDDGTSGANEVRWWNHWFLYSVCKSVVGIDVREKQINQLRKMGLNVKKMDAQNIKFKQKFDIVFAGELIEHLPNPGQFLVSAANSLAKNGRIILSTPNTFSLSRLVRVFQKISNEPNVNPDHTMYFSPQNIITLANKCHLNVMKIEYAHFPFSHFSLLIELNKIGCKIMGERFKEQMIVHVVKVKQ